MRYTAPPSIDCVSDTPGPYDVYAPLSRITRAWRAVIVPSAFTPVLMSMISGWRVRLEGNSSSREWNIFTGRCRLIDAWIETMEMEGGSGFEPNPPPRYGEMIRILLAGIPKMPSSPKRSKNVDCELMCSVTRPLGS